MSDDLINLIRREAGRLDNARSMPRYGLISSYDPKRHAVKVKLQPEGIETGWVPMASSHIGNGFGVAVGPNIDDQVVVGFMEGDIDQPFIMGRMFSDKDNPPEAKSGEVVIKHQSGTTITIDKAGALTISNDDRAVTIKGKVHINP